MAQKPGSSAQAERNDASDQPKRDLKDSGHGIGERLDAAKGSVEAAKIFTRETIQELKKVQWPTRRQVGVETLVVFSTVAFVTLTVTLFDWILSFLTNGFFTVTP